MPTGTELGGGVGAALCALGRVLLLRVAVLPGSAGTPVSHEPLPADRVAPVGVLPDDPVFPVPGEPVDRDGLGDGVGVVTTPVGAVGGYGAGVPARAAPVATSANVSAAAMSSATRACVDARTADPATYFPPIPRPSHR
ncbi:hypothetical protein M6B22_15425 [Jatrophihabitans cynanchi]|uniref:Secreted protein n=1 Tax=Jatrophihabitans cynanchi TaxID=2944128 RepID=A0ABY7JXM1_9ACTN|nr:hypothetical protein [Jatrophihabitans sp. SB3-54]WAX55919.1 hypothetical protein M6B22_15425 [Jatrophihabitans sp. SB3-54]